MKAIAPTLILLLALFLSFTPGCDDDDDDDGGGSGNWDEICDDLGSLPVESGTMMGVFNFSGSGSFPLSIDLQAGNQTWTAWVEITDSNETFSGECNGQWDDNGYMTGSCVLEGSFTLFVDFTGDIGNYAACGNWTNDYGQNGEWMVKRVN